MKTLTYLKPKKNFSRKFRAIDLHRMGFSYKGPDLVFNDANKFKIVTTDEVSDFLVSKLPAEFAAVTVPEDEPDVAAVNESRRASRRKPQELPNDSLGAPADEDESSTPAADPVE